MFEQREVGSARQRQNPSVELEPGELAVQEMVWIEGFHLWLTVLEHLDYQMVNGRDEDHLRETVGGVGVTVPECSCGSAAEITDLAADMIVSWMSRPASSGASV